MGRAQDNFGHNPMADRRKQMGKNERSNFTKRKLKSSPAVGVKAGTAEFEFGVIEKVVAALFLLVICALVYLAIVLS